MQELKELIASYQTLREGGRGPAICATIIETARQCNLDKDVQLPGEDEDIKELSLDERDTIVGKVYSKCVLAHPPPCAGSVHSTFEGRSHFVLLRMGSNLWWPFLSQIYL